MGQSHCSGVVTVKSEGAIEARVSEEFVIQYWRSNVE